MSPLGKYLLWFALVGALVAVGAGGFMIKQRWLDAATLQQTQQQEKTAELAAEKAKAETKAVQSTLDDTTGKLTDATKKIDDLNGQLADEQKKTADVQAMVDKANEATKDAQGKLDDLTKALNGKSPDDINAQLAKDQSDLQAAQAEQKILQDNLQQASDQVVTLKDAIERSKSGTNKPGVAGRVTFVDKTWNFVVLNVGLSDGVVPNGELIVYRGRDFLGKIRVTKVDDNDSVAEILPDIKGDIQIGDSVLN